MKIKVKEGKALEYKLSYYQVAVKAEVESLETVRAESPEAAKRIAKQRVVDRCTGAYNEAEVRVTSTEASLAESKDEESMVYAYTDVPLIDLLRNELRQHEFKITDYRPGKAVGKGMTVERNGKTADIWITEDAVAMEMLDTRKEYEFPVKAVTRGKAEDIAWLIRDIFDGNE